MPNALPGKAAFLALILLSPAALGAATETSHFTTQAIEVGTGGYRLNFQVTWNCDDFPQPTNSAPGEVDLIDSNGNVAGKLTGTIGSGSPIVQVSGAGAASGLLGSVQQLGANGTPANASLSGTWLITGLSPGPYVLRYWYFQEATANYPTSTIDTQVVDGGGSGTLTQSPVPTPAPAPPSITILAPTSAIVLSTSAISTSATAGNKGAALASVSISTSIDNGTTWVQVFSNANPSLLADNESFSYAFSQTGPIIIRATVVDQALQTGSAETTVAVAKANQPAITVSPVTSSITEGQSLSLTATGGVTGNYQWGGSAAGSGALQTLTFASPGTYTVSATDEGNADYNPSAPAIATITVNAAFFSLQLSSTSGGTTSGAGNYPPNYLANALATPSPGWAFSGWTGDLTGQTPDLTVTMSANRSLVAHFYQLSAQTITYVEPIAISTRSAPFNLLVSSSSGLPVTLRLNSGPAVMTGALVSLLGVTGTVSITATQGGNAEYLPAQPVVITFTVGAPPSGVLLQDDSAATKRSDRGDRVTSFKSSSPN